MLRNEPPSRRSVDVYDYFSPASEIEDPERFIGRRGELARAVGALRSRGAAIVIFGHAGLGKTSLAFQIAHIGSGQHRDHLANLNLTQLSPPGGFRHPVIYYCCQRKDRCTEDVLNSVLRNAHPPFSTRALLKCKRVAEELALEENRDMAAHIDTLRMGSAEGEPDGRERPAAESRAFFAAFCAMVSRAFDDESLVVILDELNVVEDTAGMAALIKELHFVTFVLVGTAVDVRQLVRDHASVSRQLAEGLTRVKEMDVDDLKEIIRREEGRARESFRFHASAILEIVQTASGMPYFVHLLGRYSLAEALTEADTNLGSKPIVVTNEHVRRALSHSAEHMGDLDAEYLELIRSSWQREFVLKLLASREENEISLSNISPIARSQGIPAVRSQVNYLVGRGVLEQTSGTTIRFRDPRLRVFARLRPAVHDSNQRRLGFVLGAEEPNTRTAALTVRRRARLQG